MSSQKAKRNMCGKKQPSQTSTTPSQNSSNKTEIPIPYEEWEMKYDFDYDAIIKSVIETEKGYPRDNITQGKMVTQEKPGEIKNP